VSLAPIRFTQTKGGVCVSSVSSVCGRDGGLVVLGRAAPIYNGRYIDCGSNLPQFACAEHALPRCAWPPSAPPHDKPSWRGWPRPVPGRAIPIPGAHMLNARMALAEARPPTWRLTDYSQFDILNPALAGRD
jgi:hypothetical protein